MTDQYIPLPELELLSRIGVALCVKRDQQELGNGTDMNPHHEDVSAWMLEKAIRDLSRPGLGHLNHREQIVGSLVASAANDRPFTLWMIWELQRLGEGFESSIQWLEAVLEKKQHQGIAH
ncbi:MAG: hypothetical protein HLX51_00445 [Micrococcaceae bacterium]|nr:hypothetical protein [Micrococcaceae bacterium]